MRSSAKPASPAAQSEGWSASRRLLPWVLLASLALNGYHIWWGLPLSPPIARETQDVSSTGLAKAGNAPDRQDVLAWGADEVAPMAPLVYAKRTLVDGSWSHKYPPFHLMLLDVAYAPFLGYLWLSGQFSFSQRSDAWPYGLSDPTFALTILVLIGRGVSAVMGTAIVGLIYLITQRLFGGASAIFAALIVAFSFPFIYYSHTSNLDIPHLFWFTLGGFFYVRLLEEDRTRDYLLIGMCMALAVATKDQAYSLLPFLPISFLWFRMGRRQDDGYRVGMKGRLAALPWPQLGLALGAFVVTYAIAANLVNNWHGFLQHVKYITNAGSIPYQEFPNTVLGHIGLLSKTISLLARSLNIPLFVICAMGILWGLLRFRGVSLSILAPALSHYLLFLAMILYAYPRFVLPFVIILAVFGGKLLGYLWTTSSRLSWATQPAIAILLLYSLLYGASANWLLDKDPRYQAEKWIERHVPPTAVIETYGPGQYLPRFPGHVRVRHMLLDGNVEEAFRTKTPAYVLLTHAYYRRITEDQGDDFDQEEFIEDLWNGKLGYRVAGDFKASEVIGPDLIPGLNSRIVIFERQQ